MIEGELDLIIFLRSIDLFGVPPVSQAKSILYAQQVNLITSLGENWLVKSNMLIMNLSF